MLDPRSPAPAPSDERVRMIEVENAETGERFLAPTLPSDWRGVAGSLAPSDEVTDAERTVLLELMRHERLAARFVDDGEPIGFSDELGDSRRRVIDVILASRSASEDTDALQYADRVLRFAATVPCLHDLLGEELDPDGIPCECYGCAGRNYVALADTARRAPDTEPDNG